MKFTGSQEANNTICNEEEEKNDYTNRAFSSTVEPSKTITHITLFEFTFNTDVNPIHKKVSEFQIKKKKKITLNADYARLLF
jgi:hypothetical protein